MNESVAAKLLIVDDEAALMTAVCKTLELEGYVTTGFTSAREALKLLGEREFDILLTDLMMPEMDGIALLRAAQEIDRDLVGIVMTGHGTIDTAVKALQSGALDYVLKPFRLDNLVPVLSRALSVRRLQAENIRLRETLSIYELARAITRGLEHEEIVQRTLAAAMQQHDAGIVCILVPTSDGRALRVAGSHGLDSSGAGSEPPALDRSISEGGSGGREQLSAWAVSSPLPAVFEPPFAGRRRGVALPMVAGGNFYGILEFSSRAAQRRLRPGQVTALDILANTAASALEGASLLSQLRSMNQDLERRVQDRTRELEASNADLESFSYSVSHDLRAPLRAVDGFCQILVSDYASVIPDEGVECVGQICVEVERIQHLIDDLLHLARFSR